MQELQRRFARGLEAREVPSSEGNPEMIISGLAVPLGGRSEILWDFREVISPEVRWNSEDDIIGLNGHDSKQVIGRTGNNTLSVRQLDDGIYASYTLPDNQMGRDLFVSVQRGDIDGQSIGFVPLEEDWNFDEDIPLVTVTEMELREISLTAFPAYRQTTLMSRSPRGTEIIKHRYRAEQFRKEYIRKLYRERILIS